MSTARPLFDSEPSSNPRPWTPRAPRHRWMHLAAWIGVAVASLILLAVATVAFLLHSRRFHDYVLARVQSEASQSLGVPVQLQNYTLHLSTLSLDIYGLTVHGAAPYADPPLLQLQHAEVGVRIVSILHRKWYLSSLRIDHPIVQVLVDKNNVTNLPTIKSSHNSSNTSIFDLGVRHALLDQGEVYYNAQPSQLSADLHNVDFRASFNDALKMYSGRLAYSNGRVKLGGYQPLEHDFAAQFDLTPTTFQLHRAQISSGRTQINLVATATNFSAPSVQAQYDITIDGNQMARLMQNPSIPEGMIHATGSAVYHQVAGQAPLDSIALQGDLSSSRLSVTTPSLRTSIDGLMAHYSLDKGNATLHDLRAGLLGGEITAHGAMEQISGNTHSAFSASLHHISLADADRLLASKSPQPVAISGELNADATATWGKSLDDLVAHADAAIRGQAASTQIQTAAHAGSGGSTSFPLESALHVTYAGTRKEISVTQSYLRTPQTTLTMNGVVSNHSSLALRLQANDLREVATLANSVQTPKPGQQPLNLAGSASFQGTVQGSATNPRLTGQLSANNLRVNGTAWKVFRTNVDLSPSQARLQNADLEPEPKGRITLDATAGLTKWSFTSASPVQVALDASQIDLASIVKLTGQQIPVTGTLNTHVAVHGTELNPVGKGDLSLKNVVAYDQPVSSVKINFDGTGDEAHANLSIQTSAGNVQSTVTVHPKDKTYTAQLSSTGIRLDKLQAVQAKNMGATGVLALSASGQGSFENPQLAASLTIPVLTIQKQSIKNIALKADLANHVANATLTSTAVNTAIQAKARINVTGDYMTDASLDTQGIQLQPVVAIFSPAQAASLTGETELHATLHGPIKNKAALEAHLTIPYLRTSYNNTIQLASASPIQADYKNGIITVQHGAIRGTDTNLEFQGSIPINSNAPMSLLLQGNVDLQLAQLFDPDLRTSGQLKFNIDSTGTNGRNIGGQIDIVDVSYASADLPVGLEHGNGVLKLTTDRINIQSFQGTVGGGTVTAQGGIAYRPAIEFDLGLAANGVRMLYPQGLRETVDANIQLSGSTDNAMLGGTVNLANLSFTPAFDLTSFIGQFSGGTASPPSMGMAQNINLNLNVHSTNNVSLVSRELSVNGSANLQVRGSAADPVILGRVELTGGDMILNGDRFLLTGGTIQFINPSQTEPDLNVTVTTTIQQYNISLRFNGPVDQLRTHYTSDPSLPQVDIINLLAFGQTTEASAIASAGTTTAQTGEGLLASQLSSEVTSRISKIAGISQLSISPVLGNSTNQGNGANITLQQRVTGNLFVTFSTNTATGEQVIQGQYKVSPKVSFSATRDPNGGFAVDTLIKKNW